MPKVGKHPIPSSHAAVDLLMHDISGGPWRHAISATDAPERGVSSGGISMAAYINRRGGRSKNRTGRGGPQCAGHLPHFPHRAPAAANRHGAAGDEPAGYARYVGRVGCVGDGARNRGRGGHRPRGAAWRVPRKARRPRITSTTGPGRPARTRPAAVGIRRTRRKRPDEPPSKPTAARRSRRCSTTAPAAPSQPGEDERRRSPQRQRREERREANARPAPVEMPHRRHPTGRGRCSTQTANPCGKDNPTE